MMLSTRYTERFLFTVSENNSWKFGNKMLPLLNVVKYSINLSVYMGLIENETKSLRMINKAYIGLLKV